MTTSLPVENTTDGLDSQRPVLNACIDYRSCSGTRALNVNKHITDWVYSQYQNLHNRQHSPLLKETIKWKKLGEKVGVRGKALHTEWVIIELQLRLLDGVGYFLHTRQHLNPAVCLQCHFPEQRSQRKTKCTLNAATGRHETVQECLPCANQMRNESGLRCC